MKKIISKSENLKDFFKIIIFLLSSKKRQQYLIEKNACMFLGLHNLAKNYDDMGDDANFFRAGIESLKYLSRLDVYCDLKNMDREKTLKMYV